MPYWVSGLINPLPVCAVDELLRLIRIPDAFNLDFNLDVESIFNLWENENSWVFDLESDQKIFGWKIMSAEN